MELKEILSLTFSALGLLGGLFSYVLGLRIKHDIMTNNKELEKEFTVIREKLVSSIQTLRDELSLRFTKQEDKQDRMEKEISDHAANLTDKIMNTVNGKYVRMDLHQQTMASMHERFISMKELIEVNMQKIEQGLDRQILDLKERIFHSK